MQSPPQTDRARNLRRSMTPQETKLWFAIRDRRLNGLKFRRQHPIGPYFADFAHIPTRLVIEIDGGQHGGIGDRIRTDFLQGQGWTVLRFWNVDIEQTFDAVLAQIATAAGKPFG